MSVPAALMLRCATPVAGVTMPAVRWGRHKFIGHAFVPVIVKGRDFKEWNCIEQEHSQERRTLNRVVLKS